MVEGSGVESVTIDGTEYVLSTLIVQCVPVFIVSLVLEIAYDLFTRQRRKLYRIPDTISSLSAGIFQQVVEKAVVGSLTIVPYCYIFHYYHFSLSTLNSTSPVAYALCFLSVDLFYMLFHWAAHVTNLGWALHHAHHSSESYNLSTALRQSSFQAFFSFVFYLPAAFFFHPSVFSSCVQLNTVFQFFVHVKWIGHMGWLEYVLNTPSAHRVHHARNTEYLDANFAGTLIVWDRLFGTYIPERHEPLYGVTTPLDTWNVFVVQYGHLWDGVLMPMVKAKSLRDAFGFVFGPPGWSPVAAEASTTKHMQNMLKSSQDTTQATKPATKITEPLDKRVNGAWDLYVCVQFGLSLFLSIAFVENLQVGAFRGAGQAAVVILSLFSFANLFERGRWAVQIEAFRVCLLTLTTRQLFGFANVCLGPLCVAGACYILGGLSLAFLALKHSDITRVPKTSFPASFKKQQ
eukprot:ANDGO_00989.mRNA.1 C-5 sterol desaturase